MTCAVHDAEAKEVAPAKRTEAEIEAELALMLAWMRAQDGSQPDPLPSQEEMDS